MDQLNLERLGVPTITVATNSFVELARSTAKAEGFNDMCLMEVPHPVGMIPSNEVREKAEQAFPEILRMATEWKISPLLDSVKDAYPAEKFTITGTEEDVNEFFFEKGWSLGLPLILPTTNRVREMLTGTSRQPEEVIGIMPPVMCTLTVELIAVHAVMAGCKPEYMPLLIAALEGLLEPDVSFRGALSTTGSTQMVVIVNGPVVKEIGIAYEQGSAGKGHRANAAIGYALNLIAYAVGGSQPPFVDKSTLATPADIVAWVFGENEERIPLGWEPLHVERGYKKSDSVVTVGVTYPPTDHIDHYSTLPEEHLRWWSTMIGPLQNIGGPCAPHMMAKNPLVALGPEHAHLLASAGWGKNDFRQAFWEQARIPLSTWPQGCAGMQMFIDNFGPVTPESLIPITLKPDQFVIVIAGGDGKHSHYFPPYSVRPISKLVDK